MGTKIIGVSMLKVLYLPINDADNVQQGMYDAWANVGVELEICDFYRVWLRTKSKAAVAQDFLDKVRDFQPHLIHMQLQFTGLIDPPTLSKARHLCPNVVITNWSGDVRAHAIPDFVAVTNAIDYALISSTGQLDIYKQAGCNNIKYWQIGYDPKFSFPIGKTQFEYDVSFVGNNYGSIFPDGPLREKTAHTLTTVFGGRFGLFGAGYAPKAKSVAPRQTNEVYNNSLCTLSISNFNNISHYFSDRLLSCMASGRPTISWYFPGCESYFVEGSEIFIARNAQDVIDIVNYCKTNPEIATKVGINGYKRALREHTFTAKIIELLTMTKLIHLV